MKIFRFFWALFLIAPLILIHEAAHMAAALCYGMTVESYNVGFGPSLIHTTLRGIEYHWRMIPLGGYVSITNLDEFPLFAKVVVISAGCLINFITAVLFAKVILKGRRGQLWLISIWRFSTKSIFNLIMSTFYLPWRKDLDTKNGYAYFMDTKLWKQSSIALLWGFASLELGLFNLLPIFILDGGKITILLLTPLFGSTFVSTLSMIIFLWIIFRWGVLANISNVRTTYAELKKENELKVQERLLEEAKETMQTDRKAGLQLWITYSEKYESEKLAQAVRNLYNREFSDQKNGKHSTITVKKKSWWFLSQRSKQRIFYTLESRSVRSLFLY